MAQPLVALQARSPLAGAAGALLGGMERGQQYRAREQQLAQQQQIQDLAGQYAGGEVGALSELAALDPQRAGALQGLQQQKATYVGKLAATVLQAPPEQRQAIYKASLQQASQFGIPIADMPVEYSPDIDAQLTSMAEMTGQMPKAPTMTPYQAAQIDIARRKQGLEERKFKREGVSGGAGGGMGMFKGTGMEAQSWNELLTGDPSSAKYAAAYAIATKPKMQQMTNPDGSVSYMSVKPQLPPTVRAPLHMRLEQGQNVPTAKGDAVQPATGGGFNVTNVMTGKPKFNADQTKAAGFASRLASVNKGLDEIFESGFDVSSPGGIKDVLVSGTWANYAASEEGQQYDQFKRDFVNAQLRRESGAAIAEQEFESANKQYFPTPGDSAKVIEQKKKARNAAFKNMRNDSSGAYNYFQKQEKKQTNEIQNIKNKYGLE